MKALFQALSLVMILGLTMGCSITTGYHNEPMCQGKSLCRHRVAHQKMSDCAPVPYCSWLPAAANPKAIVIISPGLDESACEMHFLGTFLRARQYAVYSCDLRGQGGDRDPRRLGRFCDWQRWVHDVLDMTKFARSRYPGAPVVYIGQSTGALVVLNAASKAQGSALPKAIILQSPAVLFTYPPWFVEPALMTGQIITLNSWRGTTPGLLAKVGKSIMTNPQDEADWERSPDRVCPGFTFASVRACYSLGRDTAKRLSEIQRPVLVQYGSDDPLFALTSDAGTTPGHFVSMMGSADKQARWISRGRHDMLNDRDTRQQLLAQVDTWLRSR